MPISPIPDEKLQPLTARELLFLMVQSGCVELHQIKRQRSTESGYAVSVATENYYEEVQENCELIEDLYRRILDYKNDRYVHPEFQKHRKLAEG